MRDLYDIMMENNGNYSSNYTNDDDDGFSSVDMGMAMGFGDFIASEREDLIDIADEEDIIIDYETSSDHIDFRSRKTPVPAFEQYVQKVCGIK
jgi:hypothetical protein